MKNQNRRKFLKLSALSGAFLGLPLSDTYARDLVEQKLDDIANARPAKGTKVMGLKVLVSRKSLRIK